MSNTDRLYQNALDFQTRRAQIVGEYERRMKALQPHVGSKYFDEETKKAAFKRDEALKSAKDDFRRIVRGILADMNKANSNRGMTPPTDEELRLLQLLKMKENITRADLEAAAVTLRGNVTALSVLREIANKSKVLGFHIDYNSDTLPVDMAAGSIKDLEDFLLDFAEYDTPKMARYVQERRARQYGDAGTDLPKREKFTSKAEFFKMAGNLAGEGFDAFSRAVDTPESGGAASVFHGND